MQIREVGKRLQFLRSYYDSVAKRSRQKLIGSMSAYITSDKINRNSLNHDDTKVWEDVLTDDEREELRSFLTEREEKDRLIFSHTRAALMKDGSYFIKVTEVLDDAEKLSLDDEDIALIVLNYEEMRSYFRKQGWTKKRALEVYKDKQQMKMNL